MIVILQQRFQSIPYAAVQQFYCTIITRLSFLLLKHHFLSHLRQLRNLYRLQFNDLGLEQRVDKITNPGANEQERQKNENRKELVKEAPVLHW